MSCDTSKCLCRVAGVNGLKKSGPALKKLQEMF